MELPKVRSEVVDYNPGFIVLGGVPKSGKSTLMASLDSNLIIDCENGYKALSVMKVQARTAKDLFDIARSIKQEIENNNGNFPYRFITIDNASRIEEMALPYAASLYRKTPMGASWGKKLGPDGRPMKDANNKTMDDPKADVRTLPSGAGYLYLRQAVKQIVDMFKPLCDTLILITHVKDKTITRNNVEMSEMSIDLAGKLADIICGEADAVGLVYRDKNKTYISFEGGDNVIREARPLHLRGKKFEVITSDEDNNLKVDMSKIFI